MNIASFRLNICLVKIDIQRYGVRQSINLYYQCLLLMA